MSRPGRSYWRRFGLIWLGLLIASNAVRLLWPAQAMPAAGQSTLVLAEAGRSPVTIAYRDRPAASGADAPVVLLLHGTPVAAAVFERIIDALPTGLRIIAPDLPGFGGSSLRTADYSIAAHADDVTQMLELLSVDAAHVVAYSQGGGVALELYERAPERVRSIALLAAIGVQELELLGEHHLNHALYAVQLGFFKALAWGVPHFGYLDRAVLNVAYARNVYDSDQRPLRGILSRVEVPLLVLHGREDNFVPVAAANEHYRLVPHSELALLDGGHLFVLTHAAEIARRLTDFFARVDAGVAGTRATASRERLRAASVPFDWASAPAAGGLTLVVLFLLLVIATYVSEDLTCIAAGLLVARGLIDFLPATLACLLGIFTGDMLLYLAGRYLGTPALGRAPLKWVFDATRVERGRQWFRKRGPVVILLSRFVPGTRLATYLAAGLLGTSFARFSLLFLIAALLWTPLLVGLAYVAGVKVFEHFALYQAYGLPVVLGAGLALLVIVRVVLPLFSFRGRRLLLSRWRRLTRWEFWPPWVFYPPLIVYIIWLGVRFRGLTLFTAANPGMPGGGFLGESKSDILGRLAGAGEYLARSEIVLPGPPAPRAKQVNQFMRRLGLDFPIVLKPDVGERGRDVGILRDATQVEAYLCAHPGPTIVQEFVDGKEFGVFYYRLPAAPRGRIFAITDKCPPAVRGDGVRTLETLILADERAVCMAEFLLAKHAKALYDVPAAGQEVPLVELGTHCMGCEFRDGGWIRSAALEAVFDRVSKTYDGLYFGRYDVRTPSEKDFAAGRNFKIVELNGVSSEATSIYDPRNTLLRAYRILMRQWRLAFEIGAANRARGVEPLSLGQFLQLVFAGGARPATRSATPAPGAVDE